MVMDAIMLASSGPASDTYVADVMVILSTAAVVAIVMQRMRLAVIPAYLIAGAIVGPYALRLVRSPESLDWISSLAILLLMFGIGLHLHLSALGRNIVRISFVGLVSCLLTIVVLWPIGMLFGTTAPVALTVAMAVSMSSTAVVLRLIADRGELKHMTGRLALAILVVQDMLVIFMLASLPLLAQWSGTPVDAGEVMEKLEELEDPVPWIQFITEAAIKIGGISAMIVVGRFLLPRLLRETAREKSGEVMMIASVAVAIGAGVITQALGFSAELGAFLAGFLLAGTPFKHQISGQIAPLRDLFMAVFFTALGMQLDGRTLAEYWWVVLVGGAIMSAVKILAIGGTAWAFGATASISLAVGFTLAQAGEFSLVLLDAGVNEGIISEIVAANVIAIVVISLILTAGLIELRRRVAPRLANLPNAPWIRSTLEEPRRSSLGLPVSRQHVIIGGFGPIGRAIARSLDAANISYTVVELNPDTVQGETDRGKRIVYGDVSNYSVLDSAGLEHASVLALTMPDELAVFAASAVARRRRPDIYIAARVGLLSHGRMARDLDVDHITIEEVEVAKSMHDAVLSRVTGPRPLSPALAPVESIHDEPNA